MTISASNTNYDALLKCFYSSNRSARVSYTRPTLNTTELVKADSEAMHKIAKNLRDLEYSTDNGTAIYNNVKALVETYNNLVDSTDEINSSKITRLQKNLSNTLKDYKDDLEDIGIKVTSSGKLELDKSTLLSTSASKIGKVLSDSQFTERTISYTKRINRIADNLLHTGSSAGKTTVQTDSVETDSEETDSEETAAILASLFSSTIDVKL
ncbi:MAG: hypothetical protein LUH14_11865 [Clostridiaceae bacterium]|nr:hypothetical protein [Clostridiaceae bacterium]